MGALIPQCHKCNYSVRRSWCQCGSACYLAVGFYQQPGNHLTYTWINDSSVIHNAGLVMGCFFFIKIGLFLWKYCALRYSIPLNALCLYKSYSTVKDTQEAELFHRVKYCFLAPVFLYRWKMIWKMILRSDSSHSDGCTCTTINQSLLRSSRKT